MTPFHPLSHVPPVLQLMPSTELKLGTMDVTIDLLTSSNQEEPTLRSFAIVLLNSRERRNLPLQGLRLTLTVDLLSATPDEVRVPHIVCGFDGVPLIIWEQMDAQSATRALDAPVTAIERWARRPQDLLKLAHSAPRQTDVAGDHFSFRWVLAHERRVAQLLSQASVDHVSLHFSHEEAEKVVDLLTSGLGLLEVGRPTSIPTPGRWFASATSMIHISTRTVKEPISGRGSAPNHLCVAVSFSSNIIEYLEKTGIRYELAGSLSTKQIWVRWQSGHVFEIQLLNPPED